MLCRGRACAGRRPGRCSTSSVRRARDASCSSRLTHSRMPLKAPAVQLNDAASSACASVVVDRDGLTEQAAMVWSDCGNGAIGARTNHACWSGSTASRTLGTTDIRRLRAGDVDESTANRYRSPTRSTRAGLFRVESDGRTGVRKPPGSFRQVNVTHRLHGGRTRHCSRCECRIVDEPAGWCLRPHSQVAETKALVVRV
jgi:hypothetical protein